MKKLVDNCVSMSDLTNTYQFIKITNDSRPAVQLSNMIEQVESLEQRIKDLENK